MQSRWFWRSNRQAVNLMSEVYEWLQVAGKPTLPVRVYPSGARAPLPLALFQTISQDEFSVIRLDGLLGSSLERTGQSAGDPNGATCYACPISIGNALPVVG